MGTIDFVPGVTLDNLPKEKALQLVDRAELLSKIAELRGLWGEACEGDLSSVTLNLGLLFDDIAVMCGGVSCSNE